MHKQIVYFFVVKLFLLIFDSWQIQTHYGTKNKIKIVGEHPWLCGSSLFSQIQRHIHTCADILIIVLMSRRTGRWALFLLPVSHFLLGPVGHHGGCCWVVRASWHRWPHNAFVSCGPPKETPRQTLKKLGGLLLPEIFALRGGGLHQWHCYERQTLNDKTKRNSWDFFV